MLHSVSMSSSYRFKLAVTLRRVCTVTLGKDQARVLFHDYYTLQDGASHACGFSGQAQLRASAVVPDPNATCPTPAPHGISPGASGAGRKVSQKTSAPSTAAPSTMAPSSPGYVTSTSGVARRGSQAPLAQLAQLALAMSLPLALVQ